MLSANSLRMVPASALAGLVAPMTSRLRATAFSPSSTCTTTGPRDHEARPGRCRTAARRARRRRPRPGPAGQVDALLGDDAQAGFLELGVDLAGQVAAGGVRLEDGEGALDGHGGIPLIDRWRRDRRAAGRMRSGGAQARPARHLRVGTAGNHGDPPAWPTTSARSRTQPPAPATSARSAEPGRHRSGQQPAGRWCPMNGPATGRRRSRRANPRPGEAAAQARLIPRRDGAGRGR